MDYCLRRVFLTLLVIGLLAFANSLRNPFLIDDHGFFQGSRTEIFRKIAFELTPDKNKALGIESAQTDKSYYRPLAHIIPYLNYAAFGSNLFGYHAVNLLLWTIAAFLLYVFLVMVFAQTWPAFFAAVFFMVHPINGVVVNYITASVFAAQVIFMLLSLICLVRSETCTPFGSVQGRILLNICAVVLFILAFMCHETAMTLPFYATALMYLGRGKDWKKTFQLMAPLWAVLAIYFIFRLNANSIKTSIFYNIARLDANIFEYVASLTKLAWWYISRFFYPEGITLMRAVPVVHGAAVGFWLLALTAAGGASFWLVRHFKAKPAIALGLAWTWFGFIPLIFGGGVSPLQGVLIEPHWFIFPSAGVFIIFAYLLTKRRLAIALAAVWLITGWSYNKVWGNEELYCRMWLQSNPEFKAPSFFLGDAYFNKGEFKKARYYYERSLLNRYKDWMVFVRLGNADAGDGRPDLAKQNYLRALNLEPKSTEALNGLATLSLKEGDYKGAAAYLYRAYKSNRFDLQTALRLAHTYARAGDSKSSDAVFIKIDQMSPCNADLTRTWLKVAVAQGDKEKALALSKRFSQCSKDPATLTMANSILNDLTKKGTR